MAGKSRQASFPHRARPLFIVLAGPSGVGKDAVLLRMKALKLPFYYVVTTTTRPRRPTEKEGEHYFFVTPTRFQEMIAKGELLEWAQVYGHHYGVPRAQVEEALARGQDVIVKTDVQGAATLKKLRPDAILVFLAPASPEELAERLRKRKTESAEKLELRLRTAREELKRLAEFDYVVINAEGKVEEAVAQLQAIVTAEKGRLRSPAPHSGSASEVASQSGKSSAT